MPKLPMTAFHANLLPSIGLDQIDQLPDFHPADRTTPYVWAANAPNKMNPSEASIRSSLCSVVR